MLECGYECCDENLLIIKKNKMSKSEKIVLGGIVAVFVIAGLWWGSKMKDEVGAVPDNSSGQSADKQTGQDNEPSFLSSLFGGGYKTYNDTTSRFGFQYPKEYTVKEIPAPSEGEARSLLLSKEGKGAAVQVAVSPFDEDIVLTADRIKKDAPDLVMKSPEAVSIGSLTKGVKFGSDIGINVWFVAKGSLFQLTAFPADASALDKIVSSFKM